MSKSYSVFVDDKYYYDFVALYNSWKYYENKIPLKVYVHNGMHTADRLNQIEKVCKVVYVDRGDMDDNNYLHKFLFKYVGLLQHMDDIEIVLDADMLFLSNMDYLFDYVEEGKIIGSVENDWLTPHHVYYNGDTEQWKTANQNTKNELRKLIGDVIDNYTLDFENKVYNGGFFGFNKKKHSYLFEETIKILSNQYKEEKNPLFSCDQYMISFLIAIHKEEVYSLPYLEWMNTWMSHKTPTKIIKVDNGKLALFNEGGNRINLYHFTGDIGMKDVDGLLKPCRAHQLYESHPNETKFNRTHVEKLWYEKHENPILLLYEHFLNKGL